MFQSSDMTCLSSSPLPQDPVSREQRQGRRRQRQAERQRRQGTQGGAQVRQEEAGPSRSHQRP